MKRLCKYHTETGTPMPSKVTNQVGTVSCDTGNYRTQFRNQAGSNTQLTNRKMWVSWGYKLMEGFEQPYHSANGQQHPTDHPVTKHHPLVPGSLLDAAAWVNTLLVATLLGIKQHARLDIAFAPGRTARITSIQHGDDNPVFTSCIVPRPKIAQTPTELWRRMWYLHSISLRGHVCLNKSSCFTDDRPSFRPFPALESSMSMHELPLRVCHAGDLCSGVRHRTWR